MRLWGTIRRWRCDLRRRNELRRAASVWSALDAYAKPVILGQVSPYVRRPLTKCVVTFPAAPASRSTASPTMTRSSSRCCQRGRASGAASDMSLRDICLRSTRAEAHHTTRAPVREVAPHGLSSTRPPLVTATSMGWRGGGSRRSPLTSVVAWETAPWSAWEAGVRPSPRKSQGRSAATVHAQPRQRVVRS